MATETGTAQETVEVNELDAALEAGGDKGDNVNLVNAGSFEDEGKGDSDDSTTTETDDKAADADTSNADSTGDDTDKAGDKDADADSDDDVSATAALEEENRNLRSMMREVRKDNALINAKLGRLEKASKDVQEDLDSDADVTGEDGKKAATDDSLSRIEQVNVELDNIVSSKGQIFDVMLDVMESSEKYGDVGEVCSQQNFDEMFDSIATTIAKKEGREFGEVLGEVQLAIWSMDNPYKYMYDAIKEYHPKYQEAEGKDKDKAASPDKSKADKVTEEEISKRKKTAADAPDSIADIGDGGAGDKTGWTAARIDALPEEDLGKVPTEVYEKYMKDELK